MKANVPKNDKPKFLQDMLTGGEQLAEELKVIIDNFEKWLEISNLTFDDFIRYADVQGFKIESERSYAYTVIRLYNYDVPIGEQIAYQSDDKGARYDTVFLLLYIACRLDEYDLSERKDYFYDKVKVFCKDEILDFEV